MKNDAWSMFYSPRYIMGESKFCNIRDKTSLETLKEKANDATMSAER